MLKKKKKEKINKEEIIQLHLNEKTNFTNTNLAEACDKYSHDSIRRFYLSKKYTTEDLLNSMKSKMNIVKGGVIAFDDTMLEKKNTKAMELVYHQYSGLAKDIVSGINVISGCYVNPVTEEAFFISFDVYDRKNDSLTKIDHVCNQLLICINDKDLQFNAIVIDSYYSTHKILNLIHKNQKYYYTKVKKNRIINIKRDGKWEKYSLKDLILTKEEIKFGAIIRLNNLDQDHLVKLFSTGEKDLATGHIITNNIYQNSAIEVQKEYSYRWKTETLYHDSKQYAGLGRCEARKSIIQKNSIFFSLFTVNYMRKIAYENNITLPQLKKQIYAKFMKEQFANPMFKIE
jgi:hypothetical protein